MVPGKRSVPHYELVDNALPPWEHSRNIQAGIIETLRYGTIDEPVDFTYGLPEMMPIPLDARSPEFG